LYQLRKAKEEDIINLYNLLHRNFIKQYSDNSEDEEIEKHKKWYRLLINSFFHELFIIEEDKEIVGQIRYKYRKSVMTVNIFISDKKRGQGLGKRFLLESLEIIRKEYPNLKKVRAEVLEENIVSQNLFKNCGFEYGGREKDELESLVFIRSFS